MTVDGPFGRFTTTVAKPFARVGSHESSEVVLPDPHVARRGLYLHATDEGVFCIQLCGRQGSREPLRGWLLPNQCVSLGPYRVAAELAEDGSPLVEPPTDPEADCATSPPYPVVAITRKGHEISRHPLLRRLTVVGRGKVSTLRLSDTFVSVAHCVLYQEAGVVWLVDLLSANGTKSQGQMVESVALPMGASVDLGSSELTYALYSYAASVDAGSDSGGNGDLRSASSMQKLQADLEAQRQLLVKRESAWRVQQSEYEAELKRRSEDLARQREALLAEQQEAQRRQSARQQQIALGQCEPSETDQRLEPNLSEPEALPVPSVSEAILAVGGAADVPGGALRAAREGRWPAATLGPPTLAAALVRNAADSVHDIESDLEQLSDRVTNRLIKIQRSRILRGRLKALLAALLVAVVVIGVVLWLSGHGAGLVEWLRLS